MLSRLSSRYIGIAISSLQRSKGVSAKLLPQFVMVPIALNLNASFFYSTGRELSTAVQQEETSEGKVDSNQKFRPSRFITDHQTFELYTHPTLDSTFLDAENTNSRDQTVLRNIMKEGVTSNSKLMQQFIEQSDIENLALLRHLLIKNLLQYTLSTIEFNTILARLANTTPKPSISSQTNQTRQSTDPLAARKQYSEISQWFLYLLDHNSHCKQHGLILPTSDTFEMLLDSMIDWSTDWFYFTLYHMRYYQVTITNSFYEQILSRLLKQSHNLSNWDYDTPSKLHVISRLLSDALDRSLNVGQAVDNSTMIETISTRNINASLEVLLRYENVYAIKEVFDKLYAKYMRPVPPSDLCSMKAAGYAALVTNNLKFIAKIMQLSLRHYLQNTPFKEHPVVMPEAIANSSRTYLEELQRFLLSPENKHIHPVILSHPGSEQSYAILMGFLLKSSGDSVAVKNLWEAFLGGVQGNKQQITSFLDTVGLYASKIKDNANIIVNTSNFLKTVIFSAGTTIDAFNLAPAAVDNIVNIFYVNQDIQAISSLLILCMKKNILISETSMMKVLQLIQREGEHQLVLELFESYLAAVESSKPNQLHESTANKGQDEFEVVDATQSDHANDKYKKRVPLIYGTVIKSLGELGEIDLLLSLLRDELPSRGYHIRRALYGVAMTGCNKHMKYNEALELFYLAKKNLTGTEKQSLYFDGYLLHSAFIATAKSFQSGAALKLMKDYLHYENDGKRLPTADVRVMINLAITSCSQQKCPTHIEKSVFRTHLSLLYKMLANHSKAYGNDPLIAANISVTAIILEDAFTLKQVLRNTMMKKHKLQDAMTKIFRQDWTEAHEAFYQKCVDSADD